MFWPIGHQLKTYVFLFYFILIFIFPLPTDIFFILNHKIIIKAPHIQHYNKLDGWEEK